MNASDWALCGATVVGPILAVQAQKWVERWRERQNRKMWVSQTLMSTRAARLGADHIRALNMIDLVFYGTRLLGKNWRSNTEQDVLDAWKEYLDELAVPWDMGANNEARAVRRTDLFIDLLEQIGTDVRYKFDRVQLNKGAYQPLAHDAESAEQRELRRTAIEIFSGTKSLKMDISHFPVNEAATKSMTEFHERLAEALDGKRSLSVKVQDEKSAG